MLLFCTTHYIANKHVFAYFWNIRKKIIVVLLFAFGDGCGITYIYINFPIFWIFGCFLVNSFLELVLYLSIIHIQIDFEHIAIEKPQ